MPVDKFGKTDRYRVVCEIERVQNVELHKVGGFQRFYYDKSGKYYCIFGGTGNWHGISESVQRFMERHRENMYLVVAKISRNTFEIYFGQINIIGIILQNIDSLPLATRNSVGEQRQFNLEFHGDSVSMREISLVNLRRISSI